MKRLVLLSTALIVLSMMLAIPLTSESASTLVEKTLGDNQIGLAGMELSIPLTVKVSAAGVPTENIQVDFVVASGGGILGHTSVNTNSEGIAQTTLTLGLSIGINTIEVRITNFLFTTFTTLSVKPVTELMPNGGTFTPDIWKKFKGETVPDTDNVPDIVDWSYAGYKNGSESIPNTDELGVRTYDVTTYAAFPDDGRSDVDGIKRALRAAKYGGIVYFPPGQYDVFLEGDSRRQFIVEGHNVVIKGSGAEGAARGGTTIKMHDKIDGRNHLFTTKWRGSGKSSATTVQGTFPKGTKHFDVADASSFSNKKFLVITAGNLLGEDWNEHSSRPLSSMISGYTNIRNGIDIFEIHEIDYIDGNRIYVKAPVLTHLNSNFKVYWRAMSERIGFEDLHIDAGLDETYSHLQQKNRGGIYLWHTAHSWVRRCRFSNVVAACISHISYTTTMTSIVVDGRFGHNSVTSSISTYPLFSLIEDYTDKGVHHGVSITSKSAGAVCFGIGGWKIKSPDTHGDMPRNTLFDNYFSNGHHSSGGAVSNLPHHLDGYVRWNNKVAASSTLNLWNPNRYNYAVTQGSMIGYIQTSGSAPINAYVENFGSHVFPNSLYEAQLERRLGYRPVWIDEMKDGHVEFFKDVFGLYENRDPEFDSSFVTSIEVEENVAKNTLISYNLPATDPDGHTITYTLEGTDAASFKLSSKLGRIRTVAALDYETKSEYSIDIKASDAYGGEAILTISITIVDVNENYLLYGRTQQVQDAVVAKIAGIDRAEDVQEAQLSNIVYLDIRNKNITALKSGDFDGMTSLTQLRLESNSLKTLPSDVFSELSSLQYLYLGSNALTELPEEVFSGLDELVFLYLNTNKIKELPSGIFSGLSSIFMINLSTNKLTSLRKGTFTGLTSLTELYLGENEIKGLSSATFTGLSNLKNLNVSGNKLKNLTEGTFEGLTSLTSLILSDNKLSSVPDGIFGGITLSKFLYLQDNRVDPIPLAVSLEKVGRRYIKAVMPAAAPFDMVLPITVTNGSVADGATTITINAGETETDDEDRLTIKRNAGTDDAVMVSIGTLPSLPDNHKGYALTKPDDALEVLGAVSRAPAQDDKPDTTALLANYPNPFNPETWIPYQLAGPSHISITIYDIRGNVVRELSLGMKSAGYYTNKARAAYWDGRNMYGERVSGGVYFYQFKTDRMSALQKMVIVK